MAFSTSAILPWTVKMIVNPLMWLLLLIVVVGGVFIILWIRKKRQMKYPAAEVVDLGSGKMGLNVLKAGWMGVNLYLKGMWWSGREVMRTEDNEIIEQFSEEDFQEVNGQRGVVFYRDPVTRTLLPISKMTLKNRELVTAIPDAEFIDAAIDIIKDATRETADWGEKVMQFVAWALVIVFSLVAIIVIIQMVKNGQDKAATLFENGAKLCVEYGKEICSQLRSQAGSGAP